MASQSGTCAKCNKAANAKCGGCIEGLNQQGQPSPTYYCCKACLASHRSEHKAECSLANARSQVYRAGELLQDTLYVFREVGFDILIEELVTKDGKLHIYEGGDGDLFRFPNELFVDDNDKKTVLAHGSCDDAMAYLHHLSKQLLSGCKKEIQSIQEVEVVIDKKHIRIVPRVGDQIHKPNCQHQVLLVTLNDNTAYVLDPAGAQFGQMRPVVPFNEYKHDYTTDIGRFEDHGFHLRVHHEWREGRQLDNAPACVQALVCFHMELMKVLNHTIGGFEKAAGKTVARTLMLKHEQYKRETKILLSCIERDLRSFVKFVESKAEHRSKSIKSSPSGSTAKDAVHRRKSSSTAAPGTVNSETGADDLTKKIEDLRLTSPNAGNDLRPMELTAKEIEETRSKVPAGAGAVIVGCASKGGKVYDLSKV